jgi:hypothetical protein
MGKEKPKQSGKFTKKYNNNNPYNKLQLNEFHQIGGKVHASESKLLHKKKRDLERLIQHKKQQNEEVDAAKLEELNKIET